MEPRLLIFLTWRGLSYGPERLDFGPERADIGSDKADSGPEGPRGGMYG